MNNTIAVVAGAGALLFFWRHIKTSCQHGPAGLQAVVFHGHHSHVDGYAKDSSMTVIIPPKVLAGEPAATAEGADGRLIITWDKDAKGVRNATSQQHATVTRDGSTVIVHAPYYWLKGELSGESYSGQYFNPKDQLCGTFNLTTDVFRGEK